MDTKTVRLLNKRLAGPRFLKYVDVRDVDDYFNLPLDQRERWGFYRKPFALPMDGSILERDKPLTITKGWTAWENEIKKQYPVQWFFREWFLSWDNPAYAFLKGLYFDYNNLKGTVKRFIKPFYPRFRKACPRHKYSDISELTREINFALILDFWYEEMVDGVVDWQDNNAHKQFFKQIKAAVKYIEVDRPKLEAQSDSALTIATNKKKGTFEQRYGKHQALENKTREKDTELLVWMMQQREMFWT